MFAKRSFNVCAGLLCLAAAYHLGARSAGAQAGVTLEGAEIQSMARQHLLVHRIGRSGAGVLLHGPGW